MANMHAVMGRRQVHSHVPALDRGDFFGVFTHQVGAGLEAFCGRVAKLPFQCQPFQHQQSIDVLHLMEHHGTVLVDSFYSFMAFAHCIEPGHSPSNRQQDQKVDNGARPCLEWHLHFFPLCALAIVLLQSCTDELAGS